jgi:predicted membrane protein
VSSTNINLDGEVSLNLEGFIDQIISFGQNNPLIALIVAIIFLFLLFLRPKLTLLLLLLMLILAGIYYSIMDAASSASHEKQKLIQKSRQSSEINKQ